MGVKVQLVKVAPDLFRCLTPSDVAAVDRIAVGEGANFDIRKSRNYPFLKKYFSLLKTGFEAYEPQSFEVNGEVHEPRKDFDGFREWVITKAGFFDVIGLPDGSVKLVAKSISFANMEEDEFGELFSATIDVMLQHVLPSTWSEQDLQDGITRNERAILEYAA